MSEQEKRKRGRPKIDADFTDQLTTSRRAQLNAKYMFDGMVLVKNSPEIIDPDVLWKEDYATKGAIRKTAFWSSSAGWSSKTAFILMIAFCLQTTLSMR